MYRLLTLPLLFSKTGNEFKNREVEFYKYYGRYACDNFNFAFGETLYQMAFYNQKQLEEAQNDQEIKKWSGYYQAMGLFCSAFQCLGEEDFDLNQIKAKLDKSISLINKYFNNPTNRRDVHDDKLRIKALAICLLGIIQFSDYIKKWGVIFYIPILGSIIRSRFIKNNEILNYCTKYFEEFRNKYTEIPSLRGEEFIDLVDSTLKLTKNYSINSVHRFRNNKQAFIRSVAEIKGQGGYWGVRFGNNLEFLLVTQIENSLVFRIYRLLDLCFRIYDLLSILGVLYSVGILLGIDKFVDNPVSIIDNSLFWIFLIIEIYFRGLLK